MLAFAPLDGAAALAAALVTALAATLATAAAPPSRTGRRGPARGHAVRRTAGAPARTALEHAVLRRLR